MDFEIQIAHSVTDIGQTVWDHLSNGRPFDSFRWYRFGEAALSDCPPTYVILSHNSEPVARGAFWVKRQEWLPLSSPVLRFGVEQLLRRRPLLMCASPLACTPGLALPNSSLRTAALETIAHTALEAGKENRASFVFFSYIQENETRQTGWPVTFSAISYSDEDTVLEIDWPDFDSYLKQLAKSTRRNHRLHCKQADEMGVVITTHSSVSDLEQAITLIENVERYHHTGHRPWTRTMLENAHLVDATWIAARIGDRLVGCCSVIGDGNARIATLLGLDYSVPEFIYVYYQIIYAAVRTAIEQGARILYGGSSAYELKRRLRFQKVPNDYLMVAATGKSFQWLERRLVKWSGLQKPDASTPEESNDPDRETDDTP